MWLKSDASVDVVAFFILRTPTRPGEGRAGRARAHPLPRRRALHRAPPDLRRRRPPGLRRAPYGLTKHLRELARYVRGRRRPHHGRRPELVRRRALRGHAARRGAPRRARRRPAAAAADLAVRARGSPRPAARRRCSRRSARCVGEELPEMPGTNVLGDVRPGATVLLDAPDAHDARAARRCRSSRSASRGAAAPSRSASTARTGCSSRDFAARAAGRAHGALWDGLLGWLMRDPRFEPAEIDVQGRLHRRRGRDAASLRPLAGQKGEADAQDRAPRHAASAVRDAARPTLDGSGKPVELAVGALEAGGYSAVVQIGDGAGKGPDHAPRLRVREGRRRVGRLAPRRGAPRGHRGGDRRQAT